MARTLPIKRITFLYQWEAGLTEYQENSYEDQPYEVFPRKEQVIVTRWYTKDGLLID